jgi:hypothetical protein
LNAKHKVFSFTCRFFSVTDISLDIGGFCDWSRLSQNQMYEHFSDNLEAMYTWLQARRNLKIGNTIDCGHKNVTEIETALGKYF